MILFLSPIVSEADIIAVANTKTDVVIDKITENDLKLYANDIRKYIETFANQIETSKLYKVDLIDYNNVDFVNTYGVTYDID